MDDGDEVTTTSWTAEAIVTEFVDEPAGTGLKVTDVDDVTTILPVDEAAGTDATTADGVNDQETNTDSAEQQRTEFKIDHEHEIVTQLPIASDVTEFLTTQRPEVEGEFVRTSDGSGEGSGDATFIRLEQSPPEEINMDPIVTTESEIDNKAEMLENLMIQEELRPHAAPRTTTAESITIENEEFIHPTSQSPAGIAEKPVTQEPVVSSEIDSVQIEIAKVKTEDSALSISAQLKGDSEQDITHILMEIPALPQSENQVRGEEEVQSSTEEPETVTIIDFKNELGSAVDIHSEEIAESTTDATDVVKSVRPQEADDRPEESVVTDSMTDKTAGDATEFQVAGNGFDTLLPTAVHNDEPEFKAEGSGDASAIKILTSDDVAGLAMEGSGSDPVEIQIGQSLEGSGSSDRMDEPESPDEIAADEDESPPEFRNDDILINRIRTIVNSLTNPRETSSILFRRTSGLFQSVFKRTKRQSEQIDPAYLVRTPEFLRFLRTQPMPLRRALSPNFYGRFSRQMHPQSDVESSHEEEGDECDLHIKVSSDSPPHRLQLNTDRISQQTDPGLHLLLTFHNLSAPYTVDCAGAYVEIEREGNGFEARWCGNPIGQVIQPPNYIRYHPTIMDLITPLVCSREESGRTSSSPAQRSESPSTVTKTPYSKIRSIPARAATLSTRNWPLTNPFHLPDSVPISKVNPFQIGSTKSTKLNVHIFFSRSY